MLRTCNVCNATKEHASWKSTTCNDCLSKGLKYCSSCNEILALGDFYLCRGKPMGMCKACEKKRSQQGKIDSGYLDRPEVIAKRNLSSKINKRKVHQDPVRRQAIYDAHNYRLKIRRKEDPEYYERVIASSRARKENLVGILTAKEWQNTLEYFNNQCAYCGAETKLCREHVVPISKKGLNETQNIVPACISCNSSKKDKDMLDWYKETKFFSEARLAKIMEWKGGASRVPKRS